MVVSVKGGMPDRGTRQLSLSSMSARCIPELGIAKICLSVTWPVTRIDQSPLLLFSSSAVSLHTRDLIIDGIYASKNRLRTFNLLPQIHSSFYSVPSSALFNQLLFSTLRPRQIGYGRQKHSYRLGRQVPSGCWDQVRKDNQFSISPNIEELNRDVRQTDKIYHFQNCGTIYIDSFNARGVRMKNCGNNIPQVTCSLIFSSALFSYNLAIPYYSDHRPERVLHSTSPGLSNGMWTLAHLRLLRKLFE